MLRWNEALVLLGALALAGCGDSALNGGAPDGATGDASAEVSDGGDDGGGDGGDGGMLSCGPIGEVCVNGASCCSGVCDGATRRCIAPPNVCGPQGAVCQAPTDCCSLHCIGGTCAAACVQNGQKCGASEDCCSGNCAGGTCQPVVQGGCITLGNACTNGGECCSRNCQGGMCVAQGGPCNAIGDVCFRGTDCCSGLCTIPQGKMAGTCTGVNGGGGGNCTQDGEPCAGCSTCCSRVCAPTMTGGHICVPASGCRVIGDICHKDSDCCGGGATGLPGANSVTCNLVFGVNPPIGTCSNPNGCDPDGDVCGLSMGNNTCGNARHDCCDCMPPKINCCKFDKAGVPRCYGGSTKECPDGYTGKPPCCIPEGQICAFSSECCNGAPCVPDNKGQLRCGGDCQMAGEVCTADSDCCAGLPCVIPKGQLIGTCMPPRVVPDMGPPCSLVGQSCSTEQPCCSGLNCTPPGGNGACQPGEMDCTCVGGIG